MAYFGRSGAWSQLRLDSLFLWETPVDSGRPALYTGGLSRSWDVGCVWRYQAWRIGCGVNATAQGLGGQLIGGGCGWGIGRLAAGKVRRSGLVDPKSGRRSAQSEGRLRLRAEASFRHWTAGLSGVRERVVALRVGSGESPAGVREVCLGEFFDRLCRNRVFEAVLCSRRSCAPFSWLSPTLGWSQGGSWLVAERVMVGCGASHSRAVDC